MPENVIWQAVWVVLGGVTFVAALLAGSSRRAMYVGRVAVAALYTIGGATFNGLNLATGGDYGDFADSSYIPFVRDTWQSVVAPRQYIFISLLVAFEFMVGVLVISGARRTQLGLVGAIGFHIALLSFGWMFYPWSIAICFALVLLLRAERKQPVSAISADVDTARLAA